MSGAWFQHTQAHASTTKPPRYVLLVLLLAYNLPTHNTIVIITCRSGIP
jgi:hypothetical protein